MIRHEVTLDKVTLEVLSFRLGKIPDGVNAYFDAKSMDIKGTAKSVALFAKAAICLETEIDAMEPKNPGRVSYLGMLYECYQALCVETSLPQELRRVKLPYGWGHYIQRAVEISQELEGYKSRI